MTQIDINLSNPLSTYGYLGTLVCIQCNGTAEVKAAEPDVYHERYDRNKIVHCGFNVMTAELLDEMDFYILI